MSGGSPGGAGSGISGPGGPEERTSGGRLGAQGARDQSDNGYGKLESEASNQELWEPRRDQNMISSLDALTLKKRGKTGEKLPSGLRKHLSSYHNNHCQLQTTRQADQICPVPQGLDPRPSSVLAPGSKTPGMTGGPTDLQRVYCSLRSSPNPTVDSQDQSYTILQMASTSAQKGIGLPLRGQQLTHSSSSGLKHSSGAAQPFLANGGAVHPTTYAEQASSAQDVSQARDSQSLLNPLCTVNSATCAQFTEQGSQPRDKSLLDDDPGSGYRDNLSNFETKLNLVQIE